MNNVRGIKSIVAGLFVTLLATVGIIAIIGSGGGGGGDSNPQGGIRFKNALRCANGASFSASMTIQGTTLGSQSGVWSRCIIRAPGTYQARIQFTACGVNAAGTIPVDVTEGCTSSGVLTYRNNVLVIVPQLNCPGVCLQSNTSAMSADEVPLETLPYGIDNNTIMNVE